MIKQKFYNHKIRYCSIMEDFINDRITGQEFQIKFFEIWRFDRDNECFLERKENFQKFSELMDEVFIDCDLFELCPEGELEISEYELKRRVKIALLEAQLL